MKKVIFTAMILLISSTNLSCRKKAPEIGLSCQRLSSCYLNFQSQVKDPSIKSLVEAAQRDGEETRCISAIQSLSQSVNQDCPF